MRAKELHVEKYTINVFQLAFTFLPLTSKASINMPLDEQWEKMIDDFHSRFCFSRNQFVRINFL